MGDRVLHCWKDEREWLDENGKGDSEEWLRTFESNGTCMLRAGHVGPHRFTPDSEIGIRLTPEGGKWPS